MLNFSFSFKQFQNDRKVADAVDKEMHQLALILEAEVKERTPVRTGRLKSSIVGKRIGFLLGGVSTRVNYAAFIEYGTSRMAPRAMMRKGAEAAYPKGLAYLKRKLKV